MFLLTAGLLFGACGGPAVEEPAAGSGALRVQSPSPAVPVLRLAPGVLDETVLRGGEERSYVLDLVAGQYAELVVEQRGIDVEVRLRTAAGRAVAEIDSFNGMVGPEPLPVVAEGGGRFRLEVRSLTPGAPAGRVVVRLDALRPATPRDRDRVAAERRLADGLRFYLQDTPAALQASPARIEEALAGFRALGLPAREADALFCLAKVHDQLGEVERAGGLFRQALALFSALGDEAGAGSALGNLGLLARSRGQPEQALALYRQALALHRRAHNRLEEAQLLNNIGRAAMELGETGDAIAAFEQAIPLARSLGERATEGRALSNLGRLEISLAQPARALGHFEQAVALLQAPGDRRTLAVALDGMAVARALASHPPREVLATFQRALELQRAIGDRRREAVMLHNLGWYHHRRGEVRRAERIFRETLVFFRAHRDRDREAGALTNLGDLALDSGRPAQAEAAFARALALFAEIGDPGNAALAGFGLARARRAAGRTAEALAAVEQACFRIEALRRKPDDLDLRLTFFASKQEVYELRVELLMELHRRDPRAGYAGRALLASEEARGRTLLDLLDRAHLGGDSRAALRADQIPGLGELRRQVEEDGTLLLEYHLGEERSYLWAVTPDAIESFELPPRAVLEAAAQRVAFLLGASSRALARRQAEIALAELARRLLAPAAHRLRNAERLVIVPDGALWSVSFAALPDPAGAPAPLVANHEIVLLPALSVLPRLRTAAGRRPPPGALAVVADPVFAAADPRVTSLPAGSGPAGGRTGTPAAGFERLPYSRAEARAILALAPPRETLAAFDFAASRETVESGRLARYRIVHFATHAVLDTERPERSGLALSLVDPHGRPRDGFLRLPEIYWLRLPADLVVLSACRTALGREIRGEGLIGLTRGFFSAGARQVLVSLWPVEDRATADLMQRFYREMLVRGRPPAAALRAAQTAMWRNESWRSPYYWAGFTLQGDWRVR